MEQRRRVFNVLHRYVDRSGKRLEVPVHGLRKWWWCFPDTVHYRSLRRRQAFLLFGDDNGTVLQQVVGKNVGGRWDFAFTIFYDQSISI